MKETLAPPQRPLHESIALSIFEKSDILTKIAATRNHLRESPLTRPTQSTIEYSLDIADPLVIMYDFPEINSNKHPLYLPSGTMDFHHTTEDNGRSALHAVYKDQGATTHYTFSPEITPDGPLWALCGAGKKPIMALNTAQFSQLVTTVTCTRHPSWLDNPRHLSHPGVATQNLAAMIMAVTPPTSHEMLFAAELPNNYSEKPLSIRFSLFDNAEKTQERLYIQPPSVEVDMLDNTTYHLQELVVIDTSNHKPANLETVRASRYLLGDAPQDVKKVLFSADTTDYVTLVDNLMKGITHQFLR